ncbi:hemolysin-III channel protein Izh2 [Penicillium chermesinum]|uniref:Hemolysin-III channel protein Izh2 n=1 Tax=Penicillium chermesinum TaxID=63820 RepID=A0A9W9NST6_9EURO|nr:hemolysin-III channel protein Izh2 [Penicillium chermesinum]KAJ5225540.1 hemolysin-III channel protein Izh2 [Penicillium chermesinum]
MPHQGTELWPPKDADRLHDPLAQEPQLVSFNEIPEWYSDNEFILHGYRPISNSAPACFHSWGYLHNETANIYSHLIPGLVFLAGEWYLLQYLRVEYPRATVADLMVFAFFVLTTTVCYGLSAMYHTLMNHSVRVNSLWLQVDLIGIVLSTLGNFVSGIYVIFYCEQELKRGYWAMV